MTVKHTVDTLRVVATKPYPPAMSPEAESDYDSPKRFRAPDEEWTSFEKATRAQHPDGRSPRARVLREFMRWYMRRPGAKLPTRPDAGPWSTPEPESGREP